MDSVICRKMFMRKSPICKDGYIMVFPNFKHGNRKDGIGLPDLSPFMLGPVEHDQPGLPPCKTLENFHQFNKVYNFELNDEGEPSDVFFKKQLEAYNSSKGNRHKYGWKKRHQVAYSYYILESGKSIKYDYIQSRYWYCHFYEKLATKKESFKKLQNLLKEGKKLQITGYDGYPLSNDYYKDYIDPEKPFGHERVLQVLLTIDDPKNYPWNIYKKIIKIY